MPNFYFHVRDGDWLIEDPDGSDLPNLASARAEAIAATRQAFAEQLRAGGAIRDRSFEITDDRGRVLATITYRDAVRLQ